MQTSFRKTALVVLSDERILTLISDTPAAILLVCVDPDGWLARTTGIVDPLSVRQSRPEDKETKRLSTDAEMLMIPIPTPR